MLFVRMVAVATLLAGSAMAQPPQEKKRSELLDYIGEYAHQEVLAQPDIQDRFTKLLTEQQQAVFTKNFGVMSPIGYDSGYLVLAACRPRDCADHSAMLLVQTHSGKLTGYIQEKGMFHVFADNHYPSMAKQNIMHDDWRDALPPPMQRHIIWSSAKRNGSTTLQDVTKLLNGT